MSSPKKRSVAELSKISPSKVSGNRKPCKVKAGLVGSNQEAVVYAVVEGRPTLEPYTHAARLEVSENQPNTLRSLGFFMHASRVVHATTDTPLRTARSRGYDYKAYLVSCDQNLQANNYAGLQNIADAFKRVS